MLLNYELSEKNMQALALKADEELYYSVPADIDEAGNFVADTYLCVTTRRILVVGKGKLLKETRIADMAEVQSEPDIGCGVLWYKAGAVGAKAGEQAGVAGAGAGEQTGAGEARLIVRFSSKHLARYSYIARGCKLLIEGSRDKVVSKEPEKACPKCGRALPGTKECPHCAKKGAGLVFEVKRMLAPYKKEMVVILLLMLMAMAVTLFNPTLQKILVDDVLANENGTMKKALVVLAGMFVLGFGISIVNILKAYACSKLAATIAMDLRQKLYGKLQMLSLSFINERQPGELMNRIINDTARVREFMADTFCNLFTVLVIFVFDAVFMLVLDVKLALISFCFIPVAILLSVSFRKFIHRRYHMQWVKSDAIHNNLQDVLSGMSVVKSYGKEDDESAHFSETATDFAAFERKNEIFWAIFFPALNFFMGVGVYFVIYFGGEGVLAGSKTTGELMQFVSYTSMLYMYIGWLTNLPRQLMNMVTSVERIGDVLGQEPAIYDKPGAVKHRIEGDVKFEHASFGYKSYKPVLEDINLHIKQGEMIGLVGASGTGKSTMINLIMRLYEVDNGRILIDDIDIKDIELADFHSQIGVVLQETFLFSGTILENIRFAKPDATYEEVIRAAKMANAHDFICRTPDGYNTYVGSRGFNLSGGERQRIVIARAILNNPRLLILDEATASLDTESEYLIQKALERLTDGRTTFAIAHRLSTLKDADRLVVIDGHHIAEVGTHNELMELGGIYHGLVTAQLEMNREATEEAG